MLSPQSSPCVVKSRASKCGLCYLFGTSANPLDEPFKIFDVHLPAPDFIFLHYQPELYAIRSNPHYPAIQRQAQRLLEANAKFICGKSGLVLAEIYLLNLRKFTPISSSAWSPLPKFLQNKKAIVNVKNEDDRCFGYAIASALHTIKHGNHLTRPENYVQYFEEEGLLDIEYPVNPVDIPQLEGRLNILINLVSYFDDIGKVRNPIYISRHNSPIHINLLYFKQHYAWIKDLSRLFKDVTTHNERTFFCKRCLGHFTQEATLERHQKLCTRENYISTLHIFPEPDSTFKFTNWK